MALVKVINTTASTLHVPEPVGRVFKAHEHVTLRAAAADFDNPAINDLLRRGAIRVEIRADPNTPGDVQILPAKTGNRAFFDPTATVDLHVSYSRGVEGGDVSVGSKFNSIQAALDSIPDGFVSNVRVLLDEEVISGHQRCVVNAIPGASRSPTVIIMGKLITVEDNIRVISLNGPWVSANGVERRLSSSTCAPWETDLVEGEHIISQRYLYNGFVNSLIVWPREQSNKGTGELVSTSAPIEEGSSGPYKYIEGISINTWGTVFTGTAYFRAVGNVLMQVVRCRFNDQVSFQDSTVSNCRMVGRVYWRRNSDSANYSNNYTSSVVQISDASGHLTILNLGEVRGRVGISAGNFYGVTGWLKGGAVLDVGSDGGGSSHSTGTVSIGYFGGLDVEGGTNRILIRGGSFVRHRAMGDVIVDGCVQPMIVEDRAHYYRSSNTFRGKCTGQVLLRRGGSATGVSVWAFESSSGTQIKVGDNPAVTVADVASAGGEADPKHGSWAQP